MSATGLQAGARAYLFTYGRALDQARYAYHFEGGAPDAVQHALAAYQNADGGFGHALEPDIRSPASSVIATIHGLEICHEIGLGHALPPVRRAVAYLLGSFDATQQVWPMVTPAVEDAPHAPWWTYADGPKNFRGFTINPTAAAIAHLLPYVDSVDLVPGVPDVPDPDWLRALAATVVERIEARGRDLDLNEVHTVLALYTAANLTPALRTRLEDALTVALPALVSANPAEWESYTLQPLDVAPTPESLGAQVLPADLIQRHLDYWIATQLPDGSWPLPWRWDFVDAAAWAQAERDWKGALIVARLRTLAAYARVAGWQGGKVTR